MPLQEVYELKCDECEYLAEEEEMEIFAFDTKEKAIAYAKDGGWLVTGNTLTCPGCVSN